MELNGIITTNTPLNAVVTGGIPGFSPIATVEQTQSGATVTITDKNGTTTANILNGTATDAQVATAVDAWLDDNVTQETGYVLDSSLTMSNAAAPADKVGELKSALEQAIEDFAVPTQEAVDNWLDNHPEATTTVQDESLTEAKFTDSLKLKTIKDYVTPEMFGAKGDGVTDDTAAVQASFNAGFVLLANKYAVSDTLSISKDTVVFCDSNAELLPISNIDVLVAVGTGTVTTDNPVLGGLIKVLWYGGKINCKNGNYIASVGLDLGKLYHSKFTDISVINVTDIGVKQSGSYGALAICENIAVKGFGTTLANIGFDLRRNDQRLYNCSAVDCKVGFYISNGYVRLYGCGAWVSHSNDWTQTVAYVVDANYCGLVECTCDTVYTGILFSSRAKSCDITNLFWLCNTGVVSDYSNMRLFCGNEPNNLASVDCTVIGLQSQAYENHGVYLKRYIANDGKFTILGLACNDTSQFVDAADVVDVQSMSDKSRIIGDWYGVNMAASPTTANGTITGTMTLPAGRYLIVFTSPYITGLGNAGTACRLKMNGIGGNYHYLKNGWNEGFSEIQVFNEDTTVYVEGADAITHQNNSGSGIKAIRIA